LPAASTATQKFTVGHETAVGNWPGSIGSGADHTPEVAVRALPSLSTAMQRDDVDQESAVIVDDPSGEVGPDRTTPAVRG
jgi:hypothetical protein